MPDKKFLGSGMKFPPQINEATGRFMTSSAEQSVKESIYLILMTQRSERFARPDYGSTLMSYTFMDTNITALSMMKRDLAEQILTQEPRVSDVEITTDTTTKDAKTDTNTTVYGKQNNVDYTVTEEKGGNLGITSTQSMLLQEFELRLKSFFDNLFTTISRELLIR